MNNVERREQGKGQMTKSILHKLLLSRRLCELGCENLSSVNDLSLAIGVNLLQDSVETFLLAVSEYLNAGVTASTKYDQYFDLINTKISPKELPFRIKLVALNKLRVNSKHYGLTPALSEVQGLVETVREFLDETTKSILNLLFSTISLIDLLIDGEHKELLKAAEQAFESGNFADCLIGCRKAIFIRIESHYDAAPLDISEQLTPFYVALFGRKVPFFAQNKKYLDENVRNATDYVILDYESIKIELLESGMDGVSFWNICRLTPQVYRMRKESEWVVKHEFKIMDEEGIKERAEYVLNATINLFVAADQKIAARKSLEHRRYFVSLKRDEVPVYEKADSASRVVSMSPKGFTKLFVDFTVPALRGKGVFWHVVHYEGEMYVCGYISEDEVLGSVKNLSHII